MKRLLALLLLVSLGGCTLGDIASVGSLAVSSLTASGQAKSQAAAEQMDPDKLQSRTRLATQAFDRTTDAFNTGGLATSTSRDTAHPKFCDLVVHDLAVIDANDVGGDALALICRVQNELHEAKSAYENPNPVAYAKHIALADGYIDQLNAILAKTKGTTP